MTPPTTGSQPIRAAVVGLGWAGRSIWLPRLLAHPGFSVAAAVEPQQSAREAFAEASPDIPVLADIDQLDPELIDLAIVAVPNHLHARIAARLLERGLPVFLEKPVCLSSAEADQLAAAEAAGGAVLLAGSAAQYRADIGALAELIPSLGRIRYVELAWVRANGVPGAGGWFTRRELAGGGALVDLGWHLLDTLRPLLGPVDFRQVVGSTSGDFISAQSHGASWRADEPTADQWRSGDVEDTARGFLVTDEGIAVSLRASWASHEAPDRTVLRVEGSAGVASLECTFGFSPNRAGGSRLTVTRHGVSTPVVLPDEPIGSEYDRQLDIIQTQLIDSQQRGETIGDVRRTIAVIERLYDSARSNPGRDPERVAVQVAG
ncbi:Gfo/Idh/MocA family protein [Kitasatospora mediocidica]|uniref:Gfo/Idh/MocA family protein n=1 Tax=Kitasatospora mediocidica TaxID=58352 RepID=UPI00068C4F63|nr:Gfo/Idh/MocA family oxidoreductase [Kitasatospora mediocidica]